MTQDQSTNFSELSQEQIEHLVQQLADEFMQGVLAQGRILLEAKSRFYASEPGVPELRHHTLDELTWMLQDIRPVHVELERRLRVARMHLLNRKRAEQRAAVRAAQAIVQRGVS